MASKTCHYWPTILCRIYHSNILDFVSRGSPAEHTTLNYDSGLIKNVRIYLKYSKDYTAQKTDISEIQLREIESGTRPVPKALIDFYAEILKVKSSHLQAILFSSKNIASSRIINRSLNRYFRLILRLRKYEETK